MQLITEDLLANLAVPTPSMSGFSTAVLEDEAAATALRIFLTLSQSSETLLVAGHSAESIFWSRYYWFRRFANIRTAKAGADAGLEQQAFQILESPFPPCSPDWSLLENLNSKASVRTGEPSSNTSQYLAPCPAGRLTLPSRGHAPASRVVPLMSNVRAHQMQFVRIGEYFAASRITGPTHNLLQVRLSRGEAPALICECLSPQSRATSLNEAELIASVLKGLAEANESFGSSYKVTHIRYVADDSKPESTYELLAYKIIERLESGGELS